MDSVEILEKLVGFATVSRDSNLELIEYVRDLLAAHGIAAKLYTDAAARKANLYAWVGPKDAGGALLSGHTDVVPIDAQNWSSDPFRLEQRGERLFARGAADMKGFLACALRAALIAATRRLRTPLQLALSYDEEIGCVGVRSLIEDMRRWPHRPRLCIVGEPTLLRPAIGHKGNVRLKVICHGRAAHSSQPDRGVNAIYMASELIQRVRARQAVIEFGGSRDDAYGVPYTTLHVGVIQGGTVINIVPAHCELALEIRNLPDEDSAALLAGIRADAAAVTAAIPQGGAARIEVELINQYPGLETPMDAEVAELAAALTGNSGRIKVDFGSEAGLFSTQLGIPTVVCGPGSIEQAHKPDEFIALEQLGRCDAMLDGLLERLT
jgi:acetylornithine deacetylase